MPKSTFVTMDAKHKKCMNQPCTGPGCRVTDFHHNTAAPRKTDKLTKGERKLAARQAAFKDEGKTRMHKPGSTNRNK